MSNPYFVTCSTESIKYLRGDTVTNVAVNLSLCKSLRKSKFAWYPDNKGRPAISFDGCDVEWVYNDESTRDADYLRIVNNDEVKV